MGGKNLQEQVRKEAVFNLLLEVQIQYVRTNKMQIRTNHWDVKTYRNKLKKRIFLHENDFKVWGN